MTTRTVKSSAPAPFRRAVAAIEAAVWRPELVIEPLPSPQRIAPWSAAVGAEVTIRGDEVGNGRLVLLYDPAGNSAWDGTFRCVGFARSEVDPEMVTDPLLASVGWSWLVDALANHEADYVAPSGTVTSVASESFGGMADDPARAEVEIRASWTPVLDDGEGFAAHLAAWGDLLCMVAGIPPLNVIGLADGIHALPHRAGLQNPVR